MKIAIYGGTFAPPHFGHINLVKGMLSTFDFDKIFIIPANVSPYKQNVLQTDAYARFDMAKLAFSKENGILADNIEISDYEISTGDVSYTYNTVAHFKNIASEIYLFCGTDMLLTLDKWYNAAELFKMVTFVFTRRESDAENDIRVVEKQREYVEKYGAKIIEMKYPTVEISSTEIREAYQKTGDISSFVPQNVIEYIKERKLFL